MMVLGLSRRKTSSLASQVAKEAFEQERLRQARLTGAAKAKAQGERTRESFKKRSSPSKVTGLSEQFRKIALRAAEAQSGERTVIVRKRVPVKKKRRAKTRVVTRRVKVKQQPQQTPSIFGPL